ncbi:beta-glucosidase [Bifidobacterium samirii]|uniref:Beta-glucosidase n=1 Tax=Bifidobacterium samirii TaxID=2306974 RepID=A0A430FVC7_9BIFI|nr:beta-glucosidase [Bifidobacterium samirii]
MLSINWSDVWNVVASLAPQLIAIAVVLVLALALTFGVNKKTVQNAGTRKLIHSESWIVFLVAVVVSVSMMMYGPLASLLNSATATKYELSETTISNANKLAKEI